MDTNNYSEQHNPPYEGPTSPQHTATDGTFEQCPLFSLVPQHAPAEHPVPAYDPVGNVLTWDPLDQLLVEHFPLSGTGQGPKGIFSTRTQVIPSSHHYVHRYEDDAVQATQFSSTGEGYDRAGRPTPRHLVLQEAYLLPTRRFANPNVIEFVVNGKEGVCVRDAMDENWTGFERWDDQPLSECGRLQIAFKLHPVGCSVWKSNIATTNYKKKRRPVTRLKLAAQVAKSISRFIEREKSNRHGCSWEDMSLEHVFFTKLVRVSTASWRAEIFVERPPSQGLSSPPCGSSATWIGNGIGI